MRKLIGVDLGGTNLRVAVIWDDGTIIDHLSSPTLSERGPRPVISDMIKMINTLKEKYGEIETVGMGSPGPLDPFQGIVKNPPNLPGWTDIPLKQMVAEEVDLPVVINNDANAAGLAEAQFGAGVGYKSTFYITWSTGIGGGFIVDGKILQGETGLAGEIGNMIVAPNGKKHSNMNPGALEAMASGTAIGAEGKRQLGTEGGAEQVLELARKGNSTAQAIIDEAIHYLAIGIANIALTVDPALFVIGGGVMNASDILLTPLQQKMTNFLYEGQTITIKQAELDQQSGIIGAALLPLST